MCSRMTLTICIRPPQLDHSIGSISYMRLTHRAQALLLALRSALIRSRKPYRCSIGATHSKCHKCHNHDGSVSALRTRRNVLSVGGSVRVSCCNNRTRPSGIAWPSLDMSFRSPRSWCRRIRRRRLCDTCDRCDGWHPSKGSLLRRVRPGPGRPNFF